MFHILLFDFCSVFLNKLIDLVCKGEFNTTDWVCSFLFLQSNWLFPSSSDEITGHPSLSLNTNTLYFLLDWLFTYSLWPRWLFYRKKSHNPCLSLQFTRLKMFFYISHSSVSSFCHILSNCIIEQIKRLNPAFKHKAIHHSWQKFLKLFLKTSIEENSTSSTGILRLDLASEHKNKLVEELHFRIFYPQQF